MRKLDIALVVGTTLVMAWIAREALAAGGTCPERGAVRVVGVKNPKLKCYAGGCPAGSNCGALTHTTPFPVAIYDYDPDTDQLVFGGLLSGGQTVTDCQCKYGQGGNFVFSNNCCHVVTVTVDGKTRAGVSGECGGTFCPAGTVCGAELWGENAVEECS